MNSQYRNNFLKNNSRSISVKTTSESNAAFRKAQVRNTYREVFIDAISRFIPLMQLPAHNSNTDRFIACARVRPFLPQEANRNDVYRCVSTDNNTVTIHTGCSRLNRLEMRHTIFHLDRVFGTQSTNQDVYQVVRRAIIQSIPRREVLPVDSTIFLYGKTGTGKSHTIAGICEHFAHDFFHLIQQSRMPVRIGISAVEIVAGTKGFIVSKDNVCDLYNNGALVAFREDASGIVHLRGAQEYPCDNSHDLDSLIKRAMLMRRTQATARNAVSSRSHLLYFIRIRLAEEDSMDGELLSTITFVDLAGNEGQQDTLYHQADTDQIKDSTAINRSLASLQDCIRASANGSKVIPFRGSVLTRILKNCFCLKQSKTVFIGTISGLPNDTEQSLLTMKFTGLIKWPAEDFIFEETQKLTSTI